MTRDEALERARTLRPLEPGDEIKGATRRWVEISDNPFAPGPVRDILCWVVEMSGDAGPICDLYIADATGDIVKSSSYG
jgi:hypothetical protein